MSEGLWNKFFMFVFPGRGVLSSLIDAVLLLLGVQIIAEFMNKKTLMSGAMLAGYILLLTLMGIKDYREGKKL